MADASIARRIVDETADTLRDRFGGAAMDEAAVLVADALGKDKRALLNNLEWPISPEIVALCHERAVVPREVPTGLLVDVARELPKGARVVDVGTGSGAVALAVASERPDLEITASDLSPEALGVALANANRLGLDVRFVVADGVPPGEYDLVVANPPYVRSDELAGMDREVAGFQPHVALVAGNDGLDVMRRIVETAPSGVLIAMEHAGDQQEAVRDLLANLRALSDSRGGTDLVTVGNVP